MMEFLPYLLRLAGAALIALALMHGPIARRLRWRQEAARMSELNAMIFHVHAFFICLVLVAMGLPALFDPAVFLEPTRAARWASWGLAVFWGLRLVCQWTVYPPRWWKGLRFETAMHWLATLLWLFLTIVFAACGAVQEGWLG